LECSTSEWNGIFPADTVPVQGCLDISYHHCAGHTDTLPLAHSRRRAVKEAAANEPQTLQSAVRKKNVVQNRKKGEKMRRQQKIKNKNCNDAVDLRGL